MKMRLSTPAATREAWLAAGRLAAGAVLLTVAVAACSPGGSSVPSTFTPTPITSSSGSSTNPVTHTPSPAGGGSSAATTHASPSNPSTGRSAASASVSVSVSVSVSASATRASTRAASSPAVSSPSATPTRSALASSTPRPTVTHTVTAHATVTQSFVPTAAPETGGGGTAGLQDGLLFGLGGASVLAGLGFLALRRRLARKFAPARSWPGDPAGQDPVDREPAER